MSDIEIGYCPIKTYAAAAAQGLEPSSGPIISNNVVSLSALKGAAVREDDQAIEAFAGDVTLRLGSDADSAFASIDAGDLREVPAKVEAVIARAGLKLAA